jgi:hypothetical protein|tara:strand:+ start:345 stop:515 length:171 start_codon:yes stop_codon:yes gene_type:complete
VTTDGIALDVVRGRSRARDDGFVEATSVEKRAERGRRGDDEETKSEASDVVLQKSE